MMKTVFNRIGQSMAVLALCVMVMNSASAQSVDEAFAAELKLVEGLKVYNEQLAKQIAAQKSAKSEIVASIQQSSTLKPQVTKVIKMMLNGLGQFVRNDLPFHLEERLESLASLEGLMVDSAASDSDRYRNIMDIYTVEMEYGYTYEAYPGTQDIGGVETPVDVLRVGRLALYSQTKDQNTSFMWNRATKQWDTLPASTNRNVRTAIKVAAKTVAPELLSLPISAPEGV